MPPQKKSAATGKKKSKAASSNQAGELATLPAPEPEPVRTPEEAARIHQVFRWIIEGQTEHDIRQAIAETWPLHEATPLIIAAIDQLQKSGRFEADVVRGWCFEAYRELFRKTLEIGDFAAALRAVKLIQDMAGG